MNLAALLAVALGGALGALLRYAFYWLPLVATAERFPLGTLLVNVLGSLLAGFVFYWLMQHVALRPEWRSFLLVGVLGSFSTFSAFSLEVMSMLQQNRWRAALVYITLSLVLCILMAFAGWLLGRKIWPAGRIIDE